MRGDDTSGFADDDFRCCQVPIMLGGESHHGVELPRRNQCHPIGDGVASLDLHRRPGHVRRITPSGVGEHWLVAKHPAILDDVVTTHSDGRAVQKCATCDVSGEAFLGDRVVDGARNRRPSQTTPAQIVKCGLPFMNATVPSIGIDNENRFGASGAMRRLRFPPKASHSQDGRCANVRRETCRPRGRLRSPGSLCPCPIACSYRRRTSGQSFRPRGRFPRAV